MYDLQLTEQEMYLLIPLLEMANNEHAPGRDVCDKTYDADGLYPVCKNKCLDCEKTCNDYRAATLRYAAINNIIYKLHKLKEES